MPDLLQDFLNSPARWPLRPLLPMKRLDEKGLECGVMIEGRGLAIFDFDGDAIAIFASIDEIHRAGWKID